MGKSKKNDGDKNDSGFFSTDNRFAVPTYIAIYFMMTNYRGEARIRAFILKPDLFAKINVELLHMLPEQFEQLDLEMIV